MRHITDAQVKLADILRKVYPKVDIGFGRDATGPYVTVVGLTKDEQINVVQTVAGDDESVRVVYRDACQEEEDKEETSS